jgi:competence protein ComEC
LLIRLPEGSTLLVDGGGYLFDREHDFGELTLGPALHKLGVGRIDRMVMTHSHPDHNGGLPYVARTLPVGEFWEAAPGGSGQIYKLLKIALVKQRVPMRQLAAGDTFELPGGVTVQVLSPPRRIAHAAEEKNDRDMNEDSLVFRLKYGEQSFIFTGDAGFSAEQHMLENGMVMPACVLKIGHHGSRHSTSEEFLDRVAPRVALISAGRGNSFGLPSPRTLALLNRRRIAIYRTDLDGTIELVSDGKSLRITTPYNP